MKNMFRNIDHIFWFVVEMGTCAMREFNLHISKGNLLFCVPKYILMRNFFCIKASTNRIWKKK